MQGISECFPWARAVRWSGLVVLAAALGPSQVQAGGWTQPVGDYYLKIWDRSLIGSVAYRADGEGSLPTASYQDHQLNLYFEYGAADGLTLVAFGSPVGFATSELGSTAYLGPLVGGLRQGLIEGDWNLALEGHYGYASDLGGKVLLRQPYTNADDANVEALYVPVIENHHGELQLQLGRGLAWGWLSASAGFRLNSAFDHMLTSQLQLGFNATEELRLDLHVVLLQPLGDVEQTNVSGAGETRYLGIGLGVAYQLSDHLGVTAGLGGAALVRSNAATPSLELGVELH